jgi:hypothetical protein
MDFERPARVLFSAREEKAVINYCHEPGPGNEEFLRLTVKMFNLNFLFDSFLITRCLYCEHRL